MFCTDTVIYITGGHVAKTCRSTRITFASDLGAEELQVALLHYYFRIRVRLG